jgi:dihydropteroate synthase
MELDRVMPVVDRLRDVGVPLSVDTRKPAVMRAAIAAGVDMVNDICALGADGAIAAVAPNKVAVCLMHMRGDPQTMQDRPEYDDVVGEIERYLEERTEAAIAGGIGPDRIVVDPGFGFGKRVEHNVALLAHLDRIVRHGRPVLAGLSRKSIIGAITGRPVGERVHGSIAAAMLALERGARILRVHDVAATRDAVSVWMAVSGR